MADGEVNFLHLTIAIIRNIMLKSNKGKKFKRTTIHQTLINSAKNTGDTMGEKKGHHLTE